MSVQIDRRARFGPTLCVRIEVSNVLDLKLKCRVGGVRWWGGCRLLLWGLGQLDHRNCSLVTCEGYRIC
jgi:hypothetical protein